MKSGQYIWRTEQDGEVRSHHASREGKIFSWNDPPPGGHPGKDFNCRCWAEENDCVGLRLEKQELADKWTKASTRLSNLDQRIHNLELEIEELKTNIGLLRQAVSIAEMAETAADVAEHLKRFKHYLSKFLQLLAEFTLETFIGDIVEKQERLQEKEVFLLAHQYEMVKVKAEVRNLVFELKLVAQAYDECVGKDG
jgi:chromosome segregation ATPase